MKTMDELDALATWMRAKGVTNLHMADEGGTYTLTLGPPPDAPRAPMTVPTDDQVVQIMKQERLRMDELLFASSEGFRDESEDA